MGFFKKLFKPKNLLNIATGGLSGSLFDNEDKLKKNNEAARVKAESDARIAEDKARLDELEKKRKAALASQTIYAGGLKNPLGGSVSEKLG